jgi:hypothetical protein
LGREPVDIATMSRPKWQPPRAPVHPPEGALPRGPGLQPRRVRALDPERPALRLVTIALLTLLVTLLAFGAMWAILLPH